MCASGARSASPSPIARISCGSRAPITPPPSTTGTGRPSSPSRRSVVAANDDDLVGLPVDERAGDGVAGARRVEDGRADARASSAFGDALEMQRLDHVLHGGEAVDAGDRA